MRVAEVGSIAALVLLAVAGCGDDDAASGGAGASTASGGSGASTASGGAGGMSGGTGAGGTGGAGGGSMQVLKAFPSAYGGGADVTGARADSNAVLVMINTLQYDAPLVYDAQADVYEGGIKAAFENELDGRGRYIVSNVSGIINGGAPFVVDNNGISRSDAIVGDFEEAVTVFGQSAPRGGLTLNRGWISFIRSRNVIMRYLTVRTGVIQGAPIGDDQTSIPFHIGASDVVLDHLSASWGGDKGIIVGDWRQEYPLFNATVQRCAITDSATLAFSVNGDGDAADFAAGGNVTWHYNLMAGGNRTPNIGGFDGLGVVQNNVVHSGGTKLSTVVYGNPKINLLNNSYRIYHTTHSTKNQVQDLGANMVSIYTSGNRFEDNVGVLLTGAASEDNSVIWQQFGANGPLPASTFVSSPNPATVPGPINHPAPLLSADDAFTNVLADVGNNKYLDDNGEAKRYQDDYDKTTIANAQNGIMTYREYSVDWTLPVIPENTRPPTYDTDKDGMSDAWEMREFGDLSQGYRDDFDGDGYTNIEEYMNQVDFL